MSKDIGFYSYFFGGSKISSELELENVTEMTSGFAFDGKMSWLFHAVTFSR